MRELRPGDIVECVNAVSLLEYGLVEGNIYCVGRVDHDGDIVLKDSKVGGWYSHRFKLVSGAGEWKLAEILLG